jgi:hypothetical protein
MKPRYGIPKFASALLANGSKRDPCVDIVNSCPLAVAHAHAFGPEFDQNGPPSGARSRFIHS